MASGGEASARACVLVLAYYFPPLGGAGVQRTVKFLKHLPSTGFEAIVVTGPEQADVDWAPPDATLFEDVPPSTRIVRVSTAPPRASGREARRRRLLGRPSVLEVWWRREAAVAARSVSGDVDLVYASMSPFGSARIANEVAREAGIPWVADLRDPWALDDWSVYPTTLHRLLERRRMRSALTVANAVIMNTPEARTALLASFPELDADRVAVIPNGWDRDDFARVRPRHEDGAFRIVYTGYSHARAAGRHAGTRRLLGGAAPGLDQQARSHLTLARALARLRADFPDLASRVEIHVAGPAPVGAGGDGIFHHGYLAHADSLDLLCSADLAFLPMQDLRPGLRTTTVMGKTYEYLAAGTPILAAVPDGDVRDLLAPLPNVWLCRPNDVGCLADAIRAAMTSGTGRGTASTELLERYERRTLAVELQRVFDRVLEKRQPTAARGR